MGTAVALLLYAVALLIAAAVVWRRPVLALYLFVVGLALHNAVMALLYGLGIRGGPLTAIQAWKDVLLAVAIASVGLAAWRSRRLPFRPGRVDALALGFAALVVLYAVLPQHLLGGTAGPKGILYALRHDLSPVAAYFVGRSLALGRPELRRLAWTVLGVAAAVAAFGLVEEYAVSLDWWARHGAVGYFHDQLGFDYHGPRRLPENFVFNSGNEQELARRLVSTFLSPLGASYLFVVGLLVAACVQARRRLALGLAGLVAVGLLFTFSRASIAAAALGLCVVALLLRRPWLIVAAAALAVAGVGFAKVFPDVAPRAHWTKQELVEQRKHAHENGGTSGTGLGESSARSHFANLRAGVRTVAHHPEGFGLGNAGMVASRTHVKLKAGESTYTELGVETGLLGALAFIAWNLALLQGLLRRARERELAVAAVVAALVAVLALGIQTDVIGVPWLALCLWWIAGSLLTPARETTLE
ncbi:MAG: hypothetical protein QOG29_1496 [Gaiellaceae bacterium]|nr:hypothetical protein [Gaiellaceae bacterium]